MSHLKIVEVYLFILLSFSAILISGFAQGQNQDEATGLIAPGKLIERSESRLANSISGIESENVVGQPSIAESTPSFIRENETSRSSAITSEAEPATPRIEPATSSAVAQNVVEENTVPDTENISETDRNRTSTQYGVPTDNVSKIPIVVPPISENLTQIENAINQTASTKDDLGQTTSRFPISQLGGDRIWIQGRQPMEYRWTPRSFAGFFYDLKEGIGNETLDVTLSGSEGAPSRTISPGNLRYKTQVEDLDYKFDNWGQYQVIGFLANKYFAGYKGTKEVVDRDYNLINEGQLREVLIDSDDERTLSSGSVLPLEEGYELRIKEVDVNGNKVYLTLAKNGTEIDSKVISTENLPSSTYAYEVEIGGEDVPILFAHIASVFAGPESDLVTIDGLFQISDKFASVEPDDEYGKMKVNTVDDNGIEMVNEESLNLKKGSTEEIFGDVGFEIADADVLRFAPIIVNRVGTYDVRGTLVNPQETAEFNWNPYNFEGFYYDIDEDIGTENLKARITDYLKIHEGDLVYETSPQPVKFEFDNWGKYDVIGFLADKYFAGYNTDTIFTEETSSIDEGQLREVLLDSDDERTISTGSVLPLEEGYELRIKQVDINGNKVYLALAKNGEEIDSKVVVPSSSGESESNYMYKVDIGGKDVPIIAAHLQSVFRGTEADLATVDGIFQVSDSPKSVEEGETYDKMKVESVGDTGITMQNDDPITLSRDKTIDLMDNLRFEVADNSNRDFAPVATKSAGRMPLNLNVTEAVVNRTAKVLIRSDNMPVSGVQVFVGGRSIGTTDESGLAFFTPNELGRLEVLATKPGYVETKTYIPVMSSLAEAMLVGNQTNSLLVNAPDEVPKGEEFVISVIEFLNQTPIEAAVVFFDNDSIGNTSIQGTLRYSSNSIGDHTIRAEKEGYKSGTKKIFTGSQVLVQNLIAPAKAIKGKSINIKANVQNAGKTNDTRVIDLKVNDKIQESKEVSLNPDENRTIAFSFKPDEPGIYKISLDDRVSTITVEESKTNYALVALLLILIVLGIGFYLYESGRLDKFKGGPQGP